jgi:hypothetical protein
MMHRFFTGHSLKRQKFHGLFMLSKTRTSQKTTGEKKNAMAIQHLATLTRFGYGKLGNWA